MATPNPLPLPLPTVLVLLSLFSPLANSISDQELDAAISALRLRGYKLFGNAITTSNLGFDLLRPNSSYTLFAPTDSALFALDMASSATAYVRALRHHVALGRLSLPALHALPPGSLLPTLVPHRDIAISHRGQSPDSDFVTANGVDVVLPGIFFGQEVAVHGLSDIFTCRYHEPSGRLVPLPRSPYPHPLPCPSADSPNLWTPAPSPSADILPMVPETRSPAPTPASRSTVSAAVPPSIVDGIQPPTEPEIALGAPSGISPAIGIPTTAEILSHRGNPPEGMLMSSPAGGPTEIVTPRGNPREGIPVSSPAASPLVTGFSWNGGVRLSSGIAACGETAIGEEGCGLFAGHRGRPRRRPHASDDAL